MPALALLVFLYAAAALALACAEPAAAEHTAWQEGGGDDNTMMQLHASRKATTQMYGRYIWAWWQHNETKAPAPWEELCIRTWRKHAKGVEVRLVNDSNIAQYVPDIPEEFYRLQDASAKSDMARAALLYYHGGIYMDTDVLIMKPLDDVFDLLDKSDVIGYSTQHGEWGEPCGKMFASNIMAAQKGNGFSKTWWENIKQKITRTCPPNGFRYSMVCCHEEGAKLPEERKCRIPFAQFEHLKFPEQDREFRGEPIPLDRLLRPHPANLSLTIPSSSGVKPKPLPPGLRVNCIKGHQSFAPHTNGEVYWQRWNHVAAVTKNWSSDAARNWTDYDARFNCTDGLTADQEEQRLTLQTNTVWKHVGRNISTGDLVCRTGNFKPYADPGSRRGRYKGNQSQVIPNFFNRIAYHLFFSTRRVKIKTAEEGLQGDWLMSELFRRSLGVSKT